jgi:hypothetical protein
MVSLGIFEAPSEGGIQAGIALPRVTVIPAVPALPREQRTYVGRGGTYYELAASYGRALARRPTAAVEVLEKLSRGFETYVTILNYVRSHYFNLIDRLGHRGMEAIQQLINEEARSSEFKAKVDRLLDLYSAWRRTGDQTLLPAIQEIVDEIRSTKPDFRFDLPA